MVYGCSRNDWLIDCRDCYRCIYYASHEGATYTYEEKHMGRWSRPNKKIGRLILR
jgi:hypothetical protein